MKTNPFFLAAALLVSSAAAKAHDTWVETNFPIVRVGNDVELALKLGNHGNNHRDFRLASKVSKNAANLSVIGPNGARKNLTSSLFDNGLDLKEGFWSAPFTPQATGLYTVVSQSDSVVSYAPKRSVKTAKAYFLSSNSLDTIASNIGGFDKPLGAPFELVPLQNPVAPLGVGTSFKVRLLFKGKPLANEIVSFIRRGAVLSEGFDARYEVKTDQNGVAKYELREAGDYLLAAHQKSDEKGEIGGKPFSQTSYSATMRIHVWRLCPCCS